MELYILRHAKAEERDSPGRDDSKRPLTADGRKKMLAVAQGMLALELEFDCILTSPFARARQTAEIVARVFKTDKLFLCKPLAANGNPRHLIEELNNTFPGCRSALIVGHEPYLSHLVSLLTTGEQKLAMNFKKAGLCKLSVGELRPGRCAQLEWLLTPGNFVPLANKILSPSSLAALKCEVVLADLVLQDLSS